MSWGASSSNATMPETSYTDSRQAVAGKALNGTASNPEAPEATDADPPREASEMNMERNKGGKTEAEEEPPHRTAIRVKDLLN